MEALIWRKLGKVSLWIQGDYGREQANAALPDPTQDARWSAAGAWVTYDVNAALGLALRGDYVNDANGARSSGVLGHPSSTAHDFASATTTFNIRAWPDALLRPELRYDHSSMPSFDGAREQVSFAVSLAYLF